MLLREQKNRMRTRYLREEYLQAGSSASTPHVCSWSRGCNVEPSLCTLRTHPAMKTQPRVHHRSCLQVALPPPALSFPFSKICNTKDLLPAFYAICSPKTQPKTLVCCTPQRSLGQFYSQYTAGHSRMRYRSGPARYPETRSQVGTKARLPLHMWWPLHGLQGRITAVCPPCKATKLGLCHWAGSAPRWSTCVPADGWELLKVSAHNQKGLPEGGPLGLQRKEEP